MSSFYDDASLVMIPSCYKVSTVLCEKPTDGSGDLTFTRTGDTATRVNSSGLVEKVRTNILLQSNTFSTTWANSDSTETGGQAGYDGTNNAWLLTSTLSGGFIFQSVTISGQTTFSVYAKAGSQNGIILYSVHVAQGRNFNLSTGAVGSPFVAAPESSQIQSVGNGWYRCSITVTSSSTNNFRIYVGDGSSTALGNVVIQNAQGESGDVATAYIPTTSAAVSVGPVANVPRLDYLGSTCPRLLLEPQRTNLVTYSEQLNNAAWTKTLDGQVTITANTAVSPDGTTSADKMIPSAIAGFHCVQQQVSLSAGSASISVFAKAAEYSFLQIFDALTTEYVNFNLTNGTVGSSDTYVGTIDSLGNGWYRCKATKTVPTGTFSARIGVVTSASAPRGQSFTGNGTNGLLIWGAQLETNFATSYIPTLAASATRGADACSKTGISSLIGQTEGWIYGEVEGLTNSYGTKSVILSVNDGSSLNRVELSFNATTGYLTPRIYKAGTTIFVSDYFKDSLVTKFKFAIGYGAGRAVFYVNGTKIHEVTSLTFFTSGTLTKVGADNYNGGEAGFGRVSSYLIGTANLTNAQLAELTTL